MALARYHSNGRLDKGFGDGGLVVTDFFGLPDEVTGVAVINNKIVLVGKATKPPIGIEEEDFALARFNNNGSLDTSFGGLGNDDPGKVTTDLPYETGGCVGLDDGAAAVAIYDDRIIVVGSMFYPVDPDDYLCLGATSENFALSVYDAWD